MEPPHWDTLAASKVTASFLGLLLEAEPGVLPDGAFCLGGVCWDVGVTAAPGSGLDEEVIVLLRCCSALGKSWWFWSRSAWRLAAVWAAL